MILSKVSRFVRSNPELVFISGFGISCYTLGLATGHKTANPFETAARSKHLWLVVNEKAIPKLINNGLLFANTPAGDLLLVSVNALKAATDHKGLALDIIQATTPV